MQKVCWHKFDFDAFEYNVPLMVTLMSKETVGEAGQTATKTELTGRPKKGKKVEYHPQISYS